MIKRSRRMIGRMQISIQIFHNNMMKLVILWIVAVGELCFPVNGQNWLLEKLIPEGYDKHEIPPHNGKLLITASIVMNDFELDEKSQSAHTDLTMCLDWLDSRIQSINLNPSDYSSEIPGLNNRTLHIPHVKLSQFDPIWLPPVFFRNALSAQVVHALNNIEYLQVWPDEKKVKLCGRINVEFLCRMELYNFPFDEQYCNFELESFEKTDEPHLQLVMLPMTSVTGNNRFRVRETFTGDCHQSFTTNQFEFQQMANPSSNTSSWTTNQMDCVFAGVRFVRNFNYFVIRYYGPSFLIILTSFTSFWMPTLAYSGRINLTATVQLTLFTISKDAYDDVQSEGIVALHWWLWGCQFFVYISISELIIALSWALYVNDKKNLYTRSSSSSESSKSSSCEDDEFYYMSSHGCFRCFSNCIGRTLEFVFGPMDPYEDPMIRNKVDYFARILFPILLTTFIVVYIVSTIPIWANKYRW